MNFYVIIILSKKKIPNLNENYLQIDKPVKLLNQTTISYHDQDISFDYLIFDDIELISNFLSTNILHDNQIPITNFFKVTSIENILFTKDILLSITDIENGEI